MTKRSWSRFAGSLAMGSAGLWLLEVAACGEPMAEVKPPPAQLQLPPQNPEPVPPFPPLEPPSTLAAAPPPVSGGTLLILRDDNTAVAADPDRDAVWITELAARSLHARINLPAGSEPGRVVEDQDGNVHIALRRGGKVVKLDPRSGSLLSTRPVCPAPRGLAYDAATDNLHVACAGGELATLTARGTGSAQVRQLEPDLRDVIVKDTHLIISRFHSAELLEIDAAGAVVSRLSPPPTTADVPSAGTFTKLTFAPSGAPRLLATSDGQALMLTHWAQSDAIFMNRHPDAYRSTGMCAGTSGVALLNSGITQYEGAKSGSLRVLAGAMNAGHLPAARLIDIAVSPDGQTLGGISSTRAFVIEKRHLPPNQPCLNYGRVKYYLTDDAIACALDAKGELWVQSRNPAGLTAMVRPATIAFSGAEVRSDEGHRLFHALTSAGISCASCHLEGGTDGHTWNFTDTGPRRTQSVLGGILSTAPFHWDGSLHDFATLMGEVFTQRMSGGALTPAESEAVAKWLDAQQVVPKSPPQDASAAARGQALFNDPAVGCISCHSGSHYTNNQTVNVGTGSFQVPSLLSVGVRAPYMHDGCAATLRERFTKPCGGGEQHGKTAALSSAQLGDLIAYLSTL